MVKKLKPRKVKRKFSFSCREDNDGKWEVQIRCREGLSETLETPWFGGYGSEEDAAHVGEHMVEELQNGENIGLNQQGMHL
jgi:hypothetical protein